MTPTYLTPGVYPEEVFLAPEGALATGVPAFLGFVAQDPLDAQSKPVRPQTLTLWAEFEQRFGKPLPDGYLGPAVRGFFDNGGQVCYVVTLSTAPTADALGAGLEIVASHDWRDWHDFVVIPTRPQYCSKGCSSTVTRRATGSHFWTRARTSASTQCRLSGRS